MGNVDKRTVKGFGEEWSKYDQSGVHEAELSALFDNYFSLFPWGDLPTSAVGFDFGCGSGRWARFSSERVGLLHCIDASDAALDVARRNLSDRPNCVFHSGSIEEVDLADGSMDFGYSLGVLHHVPDTEQALEVCIRKLKEGAPFLGYVYYALDNRPGWYRTLWRMSDAVRRGVSSLPRPLRQGLAVVVAALVYWPLARSARWIERRGGSPDLIPLSFYRDRSFYVLRNDALDRLGTHLEKRFTREQILDMCTQAGLDHVRIATDPPYWRFVGRRG